MNVQRGDVVMVQFPIAGSVSTKRRPGVVVQNDRNNQRLDNVILAQVTTRLGPPNEPTRFVIDAKSPDGAHRLDWNFAPRSHARIWSRFAKTKSLKSSAICATRTSNSLIDA